jgi:hypothetical protein
MLADRIADAIVEVRYGHEVSRTASSKPAAATGGN